MQTILITGANRGIGFQLAKQYLQAGKNVIASARQPAAANDLQNLAQKYPQQLRVLALDVADAESVAKAAAELTGVCVDVLINNAGVLDTHDSTIRNINFDSFSRVLEVNAVSPLRMLQALMPNLEQAEKPRVVNISSGMGSFNNEGVSAHAYRASKAGLNKSMQVIARELKAEGFIIICMHPGWVITDMGGQGADITADASAKGIIEVIASLSDKDAGAFINYDGVRLQW